MICGRCGQPVRVALGNGREMVDVSSFLAHHRACIATTDEPADASERTS